MQVDSQAQELKETLVMPTSTSTPSLLLLQMWIIVRFSQMKLSWPRMAQLQVTRWTIAHLNPARNSVWRTRIFQRLSLLRSRRPSRAIWCTPAQQSPQLWSVGTAIQLLKLVLQQILSMWLTETLVLASNCQPTQFLWLQDVQTTIGRYHLPIQELVLSLHLQASRLSLLQEVVLQQSRLSNQQTLLCTKHTQTST